MRPQLLGLNAPFSVTFSQVFGIFTYLSAPRTYTLTKPLSLQLLSGSIWWEALGNLSSQTTQTIQCLWSWPGFLWGCKKNVKGLPFFFQDQQLRTWSHNRNSRRHCAPARSTLETKYDPHVQSGPHYFSEATVRRRVLYQLIFRTFGHSVMWSCGKKQTKKTPPWTRSKN